MKKSMLFVLYIFILVNFKIYFIETPYILCYKILIKEWLNGRFRKASKASFPQKVCFALMILFFFPWSLIYLFFWRGRCVYCGKRILFNKHVCKKCYRNSTAIVNEFDSKMETFFAQMGAVESIDDILGQYYYIIDELMELKSFMTHWMMKWILKV